METWMGMPVVVVEFMALVTVFAGIFLFLSCSCHRRKDETCSNCSGEERKATPVL